MKEYIKILADVPVFSGFSEDEIISLLPDLHAVTREFGRGEYIIEAGSHNPYIGILLEGRAHIVNEGFWGNRNLVSDIMPGQNFGEAYACAIEAVTGVSVVAETNCKVMFIDVSAVITEENQGAGSISATRLMYNLLHDMAAKNIYFAEKLSHVGERTTRAKVVSYLSTQADKQNSTEFDIPFSRRELADYLFVDRSGLSAELCKMRDEGLIEFSRNHFVLHKII